MVSTPAAEYTEVEDLTVPWDMENLLSRLDSVCYPTPTPGLTVRWGVLVGLTVLYILLGSGPSGRFLVLNPRPTWVIWVIVYGFFEILLLVLFHRVYQHHDCQRAWLIARSLNAPKLFVPGWLISRSGLSAFLIAAESNEARFLPAWLANSLLVGGGLVLFAIDLSLAVASSVTGIRVYNQFVTLRAALVNLQSTAISQYAIITLLPAACLLVNLGGLALARRLHNQTSESVEVLAHVDARSATLSPP
ncbi:hypothetical protein JCM11641_005246 [Rhodosporidiobolus odoratus]